MRILQQRLERYLNGGTAPINEERLTCGQLFEQFAEVRFPKMSKRSQSWYVTAFKHVPPGLLVVESIRIKDAVVRGLASMDYAQNTMNKAMRLIRGVFAFGIERGWVRVNPIHKDLVPDAVTVDATPYTQQEIAFAISQLKPQFAEFVRFLASTGCRPIEAVRLEWSSVKSDHVVLASMKGASKKLRPRILPFDLCPDAKVAIDTAKTSNWIESIESDTKRSGLTKSEIDKIRSRVFCMCTYQNAATAFNKALPEGSSPRGLYDIRVCAINSWRDKGWPEPLRNLLAGHTPEIARAVYEKAWTASELVRMV